MLLSDTDVLKPKNYNSNSFTNFCDKMCFQLQVVISNDNFIHEFCISVCECSLCGDGFGGGGGYGFAEGGTESYEAASVPVCCSYSTLLEFPDLTFPLPALPEGNHQPSS